MVLGVVLFDADLYWNVCTLEGESFKTEVSKLFLPSLHFWEGGENQKHPKPVPYGNLVSLSEQTENTPVVLEAAIISHLPPHQFLHPPTPQRHITHFGKH